MLEPVTRTYDAAKSGPQATVKNKKKKLEC